MADIVIKDAQGKSKTFNGVNSVQFSTAQGGSVTFAEPTVAQYKIIAAELPNVTLELYDSAQTLKESQNTGENGKACEFWVMSPDTYTIKAKSGDQQLWENTITLDEIGVYNCKSGKALEDYTWDEIKKARVGDYARYMWSVGDSTHLPTFECCTVTTFDRARNADGSGEKLMTFMMIKDQMAYRHSESPSTNGISWVGSLIRKDCLKSGEEQYIYNAHVDAETSGTYYKLNEDCKSFDEVTLPDAFDANTKYYTKSVVEKDGLFFSGMSEEIKNLIEQVEVPTWTGWADSSARPQEDDTIIITKDWIWAPSDSEVFGDKIEDRIIQHYSKIGLEGKQFDYFKEYKEEKFRNASVNWWLRSPYLTSSDSFCSWHPYGYVDNQTCHSVFYAVICFCI